MTSLMLTNLSPIGGISSFLSPLPPNRLSFGSGGTSSNITYAPLPPSPICVEGDQDPPLRLNLTQNNEMSDRMKAYMKAWAIWEEVHADLHPSVPLPPKPVYASPPLVHATVTVPVEKMELPAAVGGGSLGEVKIKKSLSFNRLKQVASYEKGSIPEGSILVEDGLYPVRGSSDGGGTGSGGGGDGSSFYEEAAAAASPRC